METESGFNTDLSLTDINVYSGVAVTTPGAWLTDGTPDVSTPVQPIADVNMPTVRFVCEVLINLPVAVLGIVANVLVLVVLRRQKKVLTTNVLLQVLSVADTLILASSVLLRSLRYVGWSSYRDVYHNVFVALYPCVYFFRLADTWITVVMTIDRYIAVCYPLRAQRLCTLRRTYVSIGVILFATFAFSMPRFFEFRLIDVSVSGKGFVHTSLVSDRTYTIAYRILLFFVVMYLVPMAVLIVLNVRLWHSLRRAYTRRHSMISNGSVRDGRTENTAGGGIVTSSGRSVTSVVVVIVVVCILCNVVTMTTHIFWILQVCFRSLRHLERTRRFLANVSNVLVTLNSASNFLVYCMVSRKFRLTLKRTFTCRAPRRLSHPRLSRSRSNTPDAATGSYLLVRVDEKPRLAKRKVSIPQRHGRERVISV